MLVQWVLKQCASEERELIYQETASVIRDFDKEVIENYIRHIPTTTTSMNSDQEI